MQVLLENKMKVDKTLSNAAAIRFRFSKFSVLFDQMKAF